METKTTKASKQILVLDLEECRAALAGRKFNSAKELNDTLKIAAIAAGADYATYVNLDTAWAWGVIETDAAGLTPAQAAQRAAFPSRCAEAAARREAETGSRFTAAQRAHHKAWGETVRAAKAKKRQSPA